MILMKLKSLKTGLLLMKNVLKPSSKSVSSPLGLTAAAPATDAAIHKKRFGYSMITVIISNEQMNDIIKIVKLLVYQQKVLAKQLKIEQKKKKMDLLVCY